MLKRKVEKDICQWIETGEKALLVYGVRQAGKTFVIKKCLEACGAEYVAFNLIEQPELISIIETAVNMDDLTMKLSLFSKKELIPGKSIIFLDEIQKCKEIVTRIKFLVEDGRFRFILSGSLLGVELVNIKSAPVGYLETLTVFPLDFEEFLQVFSVPEQVLEHLKESFEQRIAVDETVHERLMYIFRVYLLIGGMPAAVDKYQRTGNIDDVIREHRAIIEMYKLDFTQYEVENRRLMITGIYDLIPTELNEKNKRFKIKDLDKSLRSERVRDSFVWLEKAGVAIPVYNATEPMLPLKLNSKSTLFKLFLSDVGLLTTLYGKATKLAILNNEADINRGAMYENVIAQELHAHGLELYYYNSKKQGELDFVIEYQNRVLPIEVKCGKAYDRHSALRNVMDIENYGLKEAIVFYNGNVQREKDCVYCPVYMAMFLQPEQISFENLKPFRW